LHPAAGYAYYPLDHWVGKIAKVSLNYGSGNWSHAAPLVVNGDLSIGNGSLTSNSKDITLGGNWSNGGTYIPGRNTVSLVGDSQTVTGSNTFFNLVKNVGAALSLESGKLLKINGKLTMRGQPGAPLSVNSTIAGSAFKFESNEYQFMRYATVQDVDASSGRTVYAYGCADAGNNLNVVFSAPAQIAISTPAASATNPAWVEGANGPDCAGISVSVNNAAPFAAKIISAKNWFADNTAAPFGVGISATQATRIDVTATDGTTSNTVSQEIVWTPTDLKGNIDSSKTVTVRKGDSLLLTDTEDGTALWIDTKAGGTPATFGGLPGSHFACKFDATGTFTITATVTKADNSTVKHYLLVKVLSVNLDGPIACEVGYQREKGVDIFGGVNADVSFSTNDSYLMDVSVKAPMTYGSRLFLKAKKRGTPILLARLPGVNGPLLAMQEVDEFTLDIPALENTVFNAETGVGTTTITIKPYISDMTFMLNMFAHSTTFAGGVNSLNASTNVFTQIYDEESGEIVGKYTFDMEAPPTENLYCFSLKVDQHSSHGTDASTTHSVNGTLCVFTVERLISEFGETRTMTITPSAWNRLLHPHGRKHSLTIVNCAAKINPDKYDCKDGQGIWKASINSTGVAAGKYEVKIDGTSFGEKYVVVKIESIFKMLDGGNVDGNNPIYVAVNDPLMLRAIPYPNEYIAGSAPVGEWPVGAPEWMVGGTNVAAAKGNSTLNVDTSKPGQFLITAWCGTSNKSVTVNVVDVQILTIQDLTDSRVLQAPADGAGVGETLRYDGIFLPYEAVPSMTFEWQIRNGRAGFFAAMKPAAPVTTLDHTHGATGDFDVRLCASVGGLKFYSPVRRVVVFKPWVVRVESPIGTPYTSGYVPRLSNVRYVGDCTPKDATMTAQWQYKRDTWNAWLNDPLGKTYSYDRIEDLAGVFNQRIGVTFGSKTVYSLPVDVAVVDVKLEIKRDEAGGTVDYQSLTDATRKVLPGQKMNLKVNIQPTLLTATEWEWTLPGVVFKDYVANQNTGTLTALSATADLKGQDNVHFYWADTGDARAVKCRVKIAGQWFDATDHLDVKKPTCTLTTTHGSAKLNAANDHIGFYADAGQTAGISYTASVQVPAGFADGEWNFVQVLSDGLERTLANGTVERSNHYHIWTLDNTYPYEPAPYTSHPGTAGSYPTGTSSHTESDTPSTPLSPATLQSKGTHDYFHTYVMFLPPGTEARYVPLKVVNWDWGGTAINGAGGWAVTAGSLTQSVSGATETAVHPTWTANWAPFSWVP
jgi:hypothetical protein